MARHHSADRSHGSYAELDAELTHLFRAVRQGCAHSFSRLYVATRPQMFRVVLRIMREQHDAEEVLQEVYVKGVAMQPAVRRRQGPCRLLADRNFAALRDRRPASPKCATAANEQKCDRRRRCVPRLGFARASTMRAVAALPGYRGRALLSARPFSQRASGVAACLLRWSEPSRDRRQARTASWNGQELAQSIIGGHATCACRALLIGPTEPIGRPNVRSRRSTPDQPKKKYAITRRIAGMPSTHPSRYFPITISEVAVATA